MAGPSQSNHDSARVLSCKNIPGLLVWPSRVIIRQRKWDRILIKRLDLNCIQVCAAGALLNVLGPELCDEDNPTPLGKKRRAAFVKTITLTLVASIIKQTVFSKESRESIASTPTRSGTPVIPKTSSPTHPYLDPLSSYLPTSRSRPASSLANSSFTTARSSPVPKFAAPADWNNMPLTSPPSRRQSTNSIINVHVPAATRHYSLPTMPSVDQSHKWWICSVNPEISWDHWRRVILLLQASSLLALHVEVHQSPVPQFVAPADWNNMGLSIPPSRRQSTSSIIDVNIPVATRHYSLPVMPNVDQSHKWWISKLNPAIWNQRMGQIILGSIDSSCSLLEARFGLEYTRARFPGLLPLQIGTWGQPLQPAVGN